MISKNVSKCIFVFGYFDKALVVLSATSEGISVISFTSVIAIPLGIASASFSFPCSLATEIIKQLLKITRSKEKKHNKIVMLPRGKLNSIETLISQTLIDLKD